MKTLTLTDLQGIVVERLTAQAEAVNTRKSHKAFEVVYEIYDTVLGKVEVVAQIGETCPKRALKKLHKEVQGAYEVKALVAKHKTRFVTYKVYGNTHILR